MQKFPNFSILAVVLYVYILAIDLILFQNCFVITNIKLGLLKILAIKNAT